MKKDFKTKTLNVYALMCSAMMAVMVLLSGCGGGGGDPAAPKATAPAELTVNTTKNTDGSFSVSTSGPAGNSTSVNLFTTPDPTNPNQAPEMVTADGIKLYDRGGSFQKMLKDNQSKFVVGSTTFGESAIEAAIGDTVTQIIHGTVTESKAQVVAQPA